MPFITIDTNSSLPADKEMLEEVLNTAAKILNKPKDAFLIKINTGKLMLCGENPQTTGALIEVKSIGYNGKIPELAEALTRFAVDKFKAEGKFVGIHFVDMPGTNVSHGGKTMA